ncbi:MAG: hypothetical protein N0C84_20375 [Candidatus Thiodiazotropha taylori]|uniref:Phage P1-related protein n=1 Tax=Candidatus Thiodiazotropha taylori TaxID=2792791 RepID=A0A9E4N756_9GAMM|nr:hypothetical protein [Candidatus Thiodiazotropha taylori]MCW4258825.1 hypothetical protein [Candidatus Thiodiazotropha taylori]
MTHKVDWLPPLVLFGEYNGHWDAYLDAIYEFFRQDFVNDKPYFQGRRLGLKRHPLTYGKEATFWHMIQKGTDENNRTPDFRRCERIRWPRPIIENDDSSAVKIWRNQRGQEERVCLWFEQENYLVILADRGEYILPWTAYLVEQQHRQRKLLKEHDRYWRTMEQKG